MFPSNLPALVSLTGIFFFYELLALTQISFFFFLIIRGYVFRSNDTTRRKRRTIRAQIEFPNTRTRVWYCGRIDTRQSGLSGGQKRFIRRTKRRCLNWRSVAYITRVFLEIELPLTYSWQQVIEIEKTREISFSWSRKNIFRDTKKYLCRNSVSIYIAVSLWPWQRIAQIVGTLYVHRL